MVTGKVAALELVEKANNCAGIIAEKNLLGDTFAKIKSSDGLLFVTPEYNHSVPGVLKNVLDWSSRIERVMLDKPAMIVGATIGVMGTVKAQMHLRQILNSGGVGAITMPRNEVFISNIEDKLKNGKLNDESTIKFLDKSVDNFVEWASKVN